MNFNINVDSNDGTHLYKWFNFNVDVKLCLIVESESGRKNEKEESRIVWLMVQKRGKCCLQEEVLSSQN
uniref:Uncharacterized protein n=1 Tax=Tetranychus urticae TaxID=32264 RepID=T1K293_TETUR